MGSRTPRQSSVESDCGSDGRAELPPPHPVNGLRPSGRRVRALGTRGGPVLPAPCVTALRCCRQSNLPHLIGTCRDSVERLDVDSWSADGEGRTRHRRPSGSEDQPRQACKRMEATTQARNPLPVARIAPPARLRLRGFASPDLPSGGRTSGGSRSPDSDANQKDLGVLRALNPPWARALCECPRRTRAL